MNKETVRRGGRERPMQISIGEITLQGNLGIPENASGIVLFAHGSGSSRRSPRNQYVARVLRDAGLATLLFDLLTPEEEQEDIQSARLRFDIGLLARRLVGTTDWVKDNASTSDLDMGYFGASTGAAAALVAAAQKPEVAAVVSRGGRPDLAADFLHRVKAPTLFIVGGRDLPILQINQEALRKINAEKELSLVPGASHLFEEPGALEEVAKLAARWFKSHLGAGRRK